MDENVLQKGVSTSNATASKRPAEDQADKWRIPKRSAVARPAQQPRINDVFTSKNRFTNLPTDENTDPEIKSYREASTSLKKSKHIPPIVLDINPSWTHETVRSLISSFTQNYHIQYRGNNKLAIICYTAEAHQLVKDGLRKEEASFITYTRKDEKTPKVVIRGLPAYVENDLPSELASLGFDDVKVSKLISTRNPDAPCPPFLVNLPVGTDVLKFRQIKYLFKCVVTMSKYKQNRSMCTQCYRCQGFGHSSRNCNMPPRCVKCVDSHPLGQCPKTNRSEPAHCVNCNEDHPASYSKCTVRLKYIQQIRDKREQQQQRVKAAFARTSNPIDMNRKWSEVVLGKTPSTVQEKPTLKLNEPITQFCQDAETMEILHILQTIKSLKTEFTKCGSMLEKVMLILTHLGQYV